MAHVLRGRSYRPSEDEDNTEVMRCGRRGDRGRGGDDTETDDDSTMSPIHIPRRNNCNPAGRRGCDTSTGYHERDCNCDRDPDRHYPIQCPTPCVTDTFASLISPLSNVTTIRRTRDTTGVVEFKLRRSCKSSKIVTLQWEEFSGTLTGSGFSYLTVLQSFANLPPYTMRFPIIIQYNNQVRTTYLMIDVISQTDRARFYLNLDGTSTGVNMGDRVTVYASSVSWILSYETTR